MLTVTEAYAREAVTSFPSESDTEKEKDDWVQGAFYFELVLTSLLCTG